MTAISYTSQQEYIKFLKKKCVEEKACGCSEKCEEECSCCPPGLIAIYDDKGVHTGCVTPNDAELYKKNTFNCQDGYVKLFKNDTSEFLGCVSESEFAELYLAVNPVIV